MQCFLKPHRQHYIPFLPAQYCPKSIKKTLNRSFSYAMLSGGSWVIIHSVFSCADVVPTVLRQHCTRFF